MFWQSCLFYHCRRYERGFAAGDEKYTVIVQIAKTDRSSGAFLAGARLQLIRTDTGEVIEEWTSEEHTPKTFVGLKPGSYRIHELYAPESYERQRIWKLK